MAKCGMSRHSALVLSGKQWVSVCLVFAFGFLLYCFFQVGLTFVVAVVGLFTVLQARRSVEACSAVIPVPCTQLVMEGMTIMIAMVMKMTVVMMITGMTMMVKVSALTAVVVRVRPVPVKGTLAKALLSCVASSDELGTLSTQTNTFFIFFFLCYRAAVSLRVNTGVYSCKSFFTSTTFSL